MGPTSSDQVGREYIQLCKSEAITMLIIEKQTRWRKECGSIIGADLQPLVPPVSLSAAPPPPFYSAAISRGEEC